jgi:hypothetical protein
MSYVRTGNRYRNGNRTSYLHHTEIQVRICECDYLTRQL